VCIVFTAVQFAVDTEANLSLLSVGDSKEATDDTNRNG